MDQMIFRENPDDDTDEQGLGMFFRYGFARDEVNEIEHFWSVGGQYLGLIPTRDEDVLGFGFAQGILSRKLRSLEGGDRESVYEVYYAAQILPWLAITPDFQYIVNPGADKHGRDAFVAGVRVQMSF
jgi:porin